MATRRIPFARASLLDQRESLSRIFAARTADPTHGGLSPWGRPSAKHTAASTHIFPGFCTPSPETNPASTAESTLEASASLNSTFPFMVPPELFGMVREKPPT